MPSTGPGGSGTTGEWTLPKPVTSGLVALLLSTQLVLGVTGMRRLAVTYDEPNHYRYGEQILNGDASRFLDSVMPVSAINALPARIGAAMPDGRPARWLRRIDAARYVTVAMSLLFGACVFLWARDLHGAAGGVLALFLYTFDPNLLAHSQLVTTDVYAAGGIAAALYLFWKFLRRGGRLRAAGSASALGAVLLLKYSALALCVLLPVIAIGFHWGPIRHDAAVRNWGALRERISRALGLSLVFLVVSMAIVNAGFLFDRTLTPLRDYHFRSGRFQAIQSALEPIARIPVPLPYPYLEGLDWVVQRERTGEGYGKVYLLGELRQGRGFDGYYLVATLFKLPLATLAILGAALAACARRWRHAFRRDEWVLLCPIAFFTVYFNFFDRAQIGLRHFLIVFPLLYVLSGTLLRTRPSRGHAVGFGVAAVAIVLSVMSYYPHLLAYFNELVPDRRMAYRVLADSNLDWGQQRWWVDQYLAAHPDVLVEPDQPTAGTIVVHVNALTGVDDDPDKFRWLRENFRPVGHIGYAELVYSVSPAELARVTPRIRSR